MGRQAAHHGPEPPIAIFTRRSRADRPLEQLVLRAARRRSRPLQRPRATLWPMGRPGRPQPPGLPRRHGFGLERLALRRLLQPLRRQVRTRRGRRRRLLWLVRRRREAEESGTQGREEAQEQREEGASSRQRAREDVCALHQLYHPARRKPRRPILITEIETSQPYTLQRPAQPHFRFFFWL